MAAVSYSIQIGQQLKDVVVGTAAPSVGNIELRFDQTATTVTDLSVPSGKRAPKKGEIYEMLVKVLMQQLINDPNVLE
jgi:hypothetical protein